MTQFAKVPTWVTEAIREADPAAYHTSERAVVRVYLELVARADFKTHQVRGASDASLVEATGTGQAGVQRAVRLLRDVEAITVETRWGKPRQVWINQAQPTSRPRPPSRDVPSVGTQTAIPTDGAVARESAGRSAVPPSRLPSPGTRVSDTDISQTPSQHHEGTPPPSTVPNPVGRPNPSNEWRKPPGHAVGMGDDPYKLSPEELRERLRPNRETLADVSDRLRRHEEERRERLAQIAQAHVPEMSPSDGPGDGGTRVPDGGGTGGADGGAGEGRPGEGRRRAARGAGRGPSTNGDAAAGGAGVDADEGGAE